MKFLVKNAFRLVWNKFRSTRNYLRNRVTILGPYVTDMTRGIHGTLVVLVQSLKALYTVLYCVQNPSDLLLYCVKSTQRRNDDSVIIDSSYNIHEVPELLVHCEKQLPLQARRRNSLTVIG